jgi:hypothetical protein
MHSLLAFRHNVFALFYIIFPSFFFVRLPSPLRPPRLPALSFHITP